MSLRSVTLLGVASANNVARVAECIAQRLQAPLTIKGHELSVTTIIGGAISAPGKDRPTTFLTTAVPPYTVPTTGARPGTKYIKPGRERSRSLYTVCSEISR